MQGHPTRQIDAPPRSPTDDYDSQNPHLLPPQPPRKRGFSLGALFRSSKKKPVSPPSPVIPHHDNEDSIDSYEDRHPRQAPLPPPHDIHNPPYQQEPASPTKLVRRHGSTSSRTRGYDNHPSPPMQTRVSSRDGGDPDRVHRTSSNRHRERDRDRDRDRERNRDRDRGADPRGSGRHDRSYSYDERRYPPSSRRDIGNPDKYGSTRHREGSRERERSSKHRDDEYRQGSSSHRHRSSRGKHDGDDDEDSEERRRRRRERREREKDKDRERKKHDDPRTKPQSPHDQEGSHGGDGGGDFHDAPSLHESEHRPRDDPDALSVSDHIVSQSFIPSQAATDHNTYRTAAFMSLVDSSNDDLPISSRLSHPASRFRFLTSPSYFAVHLPIYPQIPSPDRNSPTPRSLPLGQLFPAYRYPPLTRILHVRSNLFFICFLHVSHARFPAVGSFPPVFFFFFFFAISYYVPFYVYALYPPHPCGMLPSVCHSD